MDDYFELIIKYMGARLGKDNVIEAVAHCDEGGLNHLHLDILLITPEGRLSSKALITREFIQSIHDKLPIVLQAHGFDVERGAVGHGADYLQKNIKSRWKAKQKKSATK